MYGHKWKSSLPPISLMYSGRMVIGKLVMMGWDQKNFFAMDIQWKPGKRHIKTHDRWGPNNDPVSNGEVFTPEYQPDVDFEKIITFEESRHGAFIRLSNREEDVWDYNSAQSLIIALTAKSEEIPLLQNHEQWKIPPIIHRKDCCK